MSVPTIEGMDSGTSQPSAQRRHPRGWRPLAIGVATLATAGALVTATAVGSSEIMCSGRPHVTPASPQAPAFTLAAASSTCAAWSRAKHRIDAASALPTGWYWHASRAKRDIGGLAAVVNLDLNRFALHIVGTDPVDVSTAARSFISAERAELRALTAQTYDNAVAATVADARSTLNLACDSA